jgi:hypothetical protein
MGTVVVFRNIRIKINTNDRLPPHVHVIRGGSKAKIEITTRKVCSSKGFTRSDLSRILSFLENNEDLFLEAWNEIHQNI